MRAQVIEGLPADISSLLIAQLQVCHILQLPHSLISIWLRGVHASSLHLEVNVTSALLLKLALALPAVPACHSLTLDMRSDQDSTFLRCLKPAECNVLGEFLAQGSAEVCSSCSARIKISAVAADSTMQALGLVVGSLRGLTHISLLNVPCTVDVLHSLQSLLMMAPRLTHVLLSADRTISCSLCGAVALLQAVKALPELQDLSLVDLGLPLYGCMLTTLADHAKLQRVALSRADLRGVVPASMLNKVEVLG